MTASDTPTAPTGLSYNEIREAWNAAKPQPLHRRLLTPRAWWYRAPAAADAAVAA